MSAETEKDMLTAIHRHFGEENDDLFTDYMPAVKIIIVCENSTSNALYRGTYQGVSGEHESHIEPIVQALEGKGDWESETPVFDQTIEARPELLL